jgi:predicted hotdog family 3-hydroxylacyl-ACP dehydratase
MEYKFWSSFEDYLLKTYNKQTVKATLLYSKRYYNILTEANAQELLNSEELQKIIDENLRVTGREGKFKITVAKEGMMMGCKRSGRSRGSRRRGRPKPIICYR